MESFPKEISKKIKSAFTSAEFPPYCQLATVDGSSRPQVRTVHYRYLEELDSIGFNTHLHSPKVSQIRRNAYVSGVFYYRPERYQLRWDARARIISTATCLANSADYKVLERMWGTVREGIRKAYWLDVPDDKRESFERVPPVFGTVILDPYLWDYYEENDDYQKAYRHVFERDAQGEWKKRKVSTIDSKMISD